MADVQIGFVPYRGTALVANDLIGGHIGLGIVDPPPSQAAIRDGRIKGLAISSKRRFDFFPDIPTFDEQGVTGYEVSGWFGIVAPAGTPPEIVAKLNAAVVAALNDPEVAQRIRMIGMEPAPTTSAEFARPDRPRDRQDFEGAGQGRRLAEIGPAQCRNNPWILAAAARPSW